MTKNEAINLNSLNHLPFIITITYIQSLNYKLHINLLNFYYTQIRGILTGP